MAEDRVLVSIRLTDAASTNVAMDLAFEEHIDDMVMTTTAASSPSSSPPSSPCSRSRRSPSKRHRTDEDWMVRVQLGIIDAGVSVRLYAERHVDDDIVMMRVKL